MFYLYLFIFINLYLYNNKFVNILYLFYNIFLDYLKN